MAKIFHSEKKIKGFTIIELLVALSIFLLILESILGITLKSYQFYKKVYTTAEIYNEIKILSLQIIKRAKYSSSLQINSDNHGIYYFYKGKPREIFFKEGALWERKGEKIKRLPSSFLLEDVEFIAENGYLWGHLSIANKHEYFEVKLP